MAFTQSFNDYPCIGDTIETEIAGYTLVARIEHDPDSSPEDLNAEGCVFWTGCPHHGEANIEIIRKWREGEWTYCTVAIAIYRAGHLLDSWAASLCGIDLHLGDRDGEYLSEVANELADEALDHGARIVAEITSVDS